MRRRRKSERGMSERDLAFRYATRSSMRQDQDRNEVMLRRKFSGPMRSHPVQIEED
jgi:hypothetical protein